MHDNARQAHGRQHGRNISVTELGRMVIADYRANQRKTSVRVREAYAHLIPYFGETPASEVGFMSQGYIAHRLEAGAAPATVRLELMQLGKGLTLAVRAGFLDYRPAIAVPKVRNVRQASITEDRIDSLLAYLPGDVRDVVEMAYLTGWRRSEILNLTWSNVDERAQVIRLQAGSTKNGEGRVLPYGSFLRLETLLRRRRKKTLEMETVFGGKIPHVFHRNGRQIRRYSRSWQTACRRAGLDGSLFHDLRRVAVTNMVRAGVPVRTAMAISGHKTRSIFDRYSIMDEGDIREGVARYAERLAGSRPRIGL